MNAQHLHFHSEAVTKARAHTPKNDFRVSEPSPGAWHWPRRSWSAPQTRGPGRLRGRLVAPGGAPSLMPGTPHTPWGKLGKFYENFQTTDHAIYIHTQHGNPTLIFQNLVERFHCTNKRVLGPRPLLSREAGDLRPLGLLITVPGASAHQPAKAGVCWRAPSTAARPPRPGPTTGPTTTASPLRAGRPGLCPHHCLQSESAAKQVKC